VDAEQRHPLQRSTLQALEVNGPDDLARQGTSSPAPHIRIAAQLAVNILMTYHRHHHDDQMDFTSSAERHGIAHEDVLHAIRNVVVFREQHDSEDDRMLVIGPNRTGRLLEVIVVPSRAPARVIHADVLRAKFYKLLS
jgi:uncharacterized DUF497 family protein